jgi:hypothetical protein
LNSEIADSKEHAAEAAAAAVDYCSAVADDAVTEPFLTTEVFFFIIKKHFRSTKIMMFMVIQILGKGKKKENLKQHICISTSQKGSTSLKR